MNIIFRMQIEKTEFLVGIGKEFDVKLDNVVQREEGKFWNIKSINWK